MLFNAIGGSYLVPNPNYNAAPSFSPYVTSAPAAPAYAAPLAISSPIPGPGGAIGLGYSAFATPTPLLTTFPIQADDSDAIISVIGFPSSPTNSGNPAVAGGGERTATAQGVIVAPKPFPWIWIAIGTLAVIVLSDDRRRN